MLLIPGYWTDTYWANSYWMQDYWPEYGMPTIARRGTRNFGFSFRDSWR